YPCRAIPQRVARRVDCAFSVAPHRRYGCFAMERSDRRYRADPAQHSARHCSREVWKLEQTDSLSVSTKVLRILSSEPQRSEGEESRKTSIHAGSGEILRSAQD